MYDAAFCLAKYMETDHYRERHGDLKGKKLIEIGAGCGNVGMMAACYGANSIITDLETLVPLMEYNIEQNKGVVTGTVTATAHAWGCEVDNLLPKPDILILANCVYYRPSLEDLLESTRNLSDENTTILACYELRSELIGKLIRNLWHEELVQEYFDIVEIPADVYHSKFSDEVEVLIVELKKKKV